MGDTFVVTVEVTRIDDSGNVQDSEVIFESIEYKTEEEATWVANDIEVRAPNAWKETT